MHGVGKLTDANMHIDSFSITKRQQACLLLHQVCQTLSSGCTQKCTGSLMLGEDMH